jgi:ABC-type antimicrobial peptide transport system permease subunit
MTGIPLVAGRDFDERDRLGAPDVAIVNETMARFYFGAGNPLGRVIKNGGDRYTIIGVVKDSKQRDLKEQTERRFYLPLLQSRDRLSRAMLIVRTNDDAARMLPTLQQACRDLDSSMSVRTAALSVLMRQSSSGERALAWLAGVFALAAAALAAIGLFGVISYATARRTREIGVRIALGARRGDILRMVLRDAWQLAGVGVVIGVPLGLVATRVVRASLVGVSSSDPATVVIAVLGVVFVATAAAVIPAVRAARVDPVAALQVE